MKININKFENASISNNETHAIKGGAQQQVAPMTPMPTMGALGIDGQAFNMFTAIGEALDGILNGVLGIFGFGGKPAAQVPLTLQPQQRIPSQSQAPFQFQGQTRQQQVRPQQQGARVQQIRVQQQVRRQ